MLPISVLPRLLRSNSRTNVLTSQQNYLVLIIHHSAIKEVEQVKKETIETVKRFEKEHTMRIETHESHEHPVYWEVTVWMTKTADYEKLTGKSDLPRVWGRKYLTTLTAGGQVLVIRNPQKNNTFTVETWGNIPSYDSFVEKVLDRIKDSPLDEDFSTLCEECGVAIPQG